jgi:hypothetical protein
MIEINAGAFAERINASCEFGVLGQYGRQSED